MLANTQRLKSFIVIIFLFLNGCATQDVDYDSLVEKFELVKSVRSGLDYEHLLLSNQTFGDKLHIYIEGDGLPWRSRYKISDDPTPRNPLALKLMTQDSSFALYVGRPCYFNLKTARNCSSEQWTNGRYSVDVIDSMEVVIRNFLESHSVEVIVLIGYSGGGAIASLLANRFSETQLVVTVAANLDVAKWTKHHGYSELDSSLDPARDTHNLASVNIHLAGDLDDVVPAHLNHSFIDKNDGKLIMFPTFDHICCWENEWASILKNIISNSPTQ